MDSNEFDKTMETPAVEPADDNILLEKTLVPMSKSEFREASLPEEPEEEPKEEPNDFEIPEWSIAKPEPVKKEAPKSEEVLEEDLPEDEKTGPRMWVPVLISCIAMIVMCISLITTYVIPVFHQNGFVSGMAKIVSPIIGVNLPPEDANVLLLGVDKDGYRTDTIMIAHYDDEAKTVTVMQIPRDTYVGGNGRYDKKINSAYFAGINQLKKEIKLAYGIDIHKYVTVDLEGFRQIVDLLGGVEVDVPIYMDYDDPEQNLHIHIKAGTQVLNGKQAEGFVRYRKSNDGVDYPREKSQKAFLSAMFKKVATPEGIAKAPEMLEIAGKYIETDLTTSHILGYASAVLELPEGNLVFMDAPGSAGKISAGYYFFVDKQEAVRVAKQYFGASDNLHLESDNIPVYVPETVTNEEPEDEPENTPEPTKKPSSTKKPTVTKKPTATPKPTAKPTVKPTATPKPTPKPKHTPLPR
ncbi:MAG: LCP family protein [Clostridia bacterium]|nr:LCP family protein [Clostridia bacterium]